MKRGADPDAYHRALLDLCHAAVVSSDARGRITSWNRAAEAMFGYAGHEVIGMSVAKLVPRDIRAEHVAGFKRRMQAQADASIGKTIRSRALRCDGTTFPVEVALGGGRVGRRRVLTAVIRDVTEYQQVVDRLHDALQRLRFHVERMPMAYIVSDTDGRVREWNPAAERMFGFTSAEAIGRHTGDLVVPVDVRGERETVWPGRVDGEIPAHTFQENVRKDGSRLTCEWFNTTLRDADGRTRGVASMAMDISEREVLEAQLRSAQKLESLGVLASGLAHDFNSLLMVMIGNTALVRSLPNLPARALEHLDLVDDAGLRASQLIKHLLAYARSGRHNPQPTCINDVIRDAHRLIEASVGNRHTVRLALADDVPTILADRSQIEQMILNLCRNAQQAMPDGGEIEIATRVAKLTRQRLVRCAPPDLPAGRYVELVVTDRGIGMDADIVARVFEPFFSMKTGGHGLGLAVVHGILRQHRGAAYIESRLRKGTRFHIFLPMRDPAAADRSA
ncbi:MAG: PAS domain S-box protein [Phycisphaerae bacterium]